MTLAEIPLDQLNEIGRVGLVGAFALLLLWRIVVLEKEKTKTAEARDIEKARHAEDLLKAWHEVGDLMREHSVVQANTNIGQEARTVAIAAMAEGAKLQAAALKELALATDRSTAAVSESARSYRDLRDAILAKVLQ